ncbi:HNT1 [Hepatospora eriocheir]|uniref:HNT1 n=1 Tax=Hepatospora eriocheir TaxID=1081669 RepID=A0A1X0Q8S1_9MICR|nr:HNT1 [Hepatospora eriocheir]
MKQSCIFCDILKDNKNIIYQTDKVFVLFDRYPRSNSHFLIIPKEHSPHLTIVKDNDLSETILLAKRIAQFLGMNSYNICQNNVFGQIINHFHLHLIEANESGNVLSEEKDLDQNEYEKIVKEKTLLFRDLY